MAIEILGRFEYDPQPARGDVYELELQTTAAYSGTSDFILQGWKTGDIKQQWLDTYGVLEMPSYFTENDRVPQTRVVSGVDENFNEDELYQTRIAALSEESFPQSSPVLDTKITAGIAGEIIFPLLYFPTFNYDDFAGKPFSWLAHITFQMGGSVTKLLTIEATIYFLFTPAPPFGGLGEVNIDTSASTYNFAWDGVPVDIETAELEGVGWDTGFDTVLDGITDFNNEIRCRLKTPFFHLPLAGATAYTFDFVPTDLPLSEYNEPTADIRIFAPPYLKINGSSLVAKTISPFSGWSTRAFRPPATASLKWAYKANPSDDGDWIYHDSGEVDFSSYATGQEWIDATLPPIPDSSEEGIFSFFALATDVWGVSGMVVVQVRNDTNSPPAIFIGQNALFYGAIKDGTGTGFYKMALGPSTRESISTLANVKPISYFADLAGNHYFTGQTEGGVYVYKSTNFGKTFTQMAQAFAAPYKGLSSEFIPGNRIGAVAKNDGKLWFKLSRDNGQTWGDEVEVTAVPEGMGAVQLLVNAVQNNVVLTITDETTFRVDSKKLGAADSWEVVT